MPVALFSEGGAGDTSSARDAGRPGGREQRRVRTGWLFLTAAAVIAIVLGVIPSPYVVEQPGPVFDTLGTVEHDGEDRPLISISDAPVYPTDGELNLLTVSVVGNRETRPNWFEVLGAWANPQKAVLPLDAVFPASVSTEQRKQANQLAMDSSQHDAIAAGLNQLGYDVPRRLIVDSLTANSPAEGLILPGDEIVAVNGAELANVAALRAAVSENGTQAPASITVNRDGEPVVVDVTPTTVGEAAVVGVSVVTEYEFPFDVQIQLDNVGGPSAGMMFALGIVDKLTPGSLTGGENWAGTGTIDPDGNVGAIGGIQQKMFGAKNAGAEWFLAPRSNCAEVVGHVPDGLTVFAVDTLDDAMTSLETVSSGGDSSQLPTCALPASAQ